jgi:hypothetical protein
VAIQAEQQALFPAMTFHAKLLQKTLGLGDVSEQFHVRPFLYCVRSTCRFLALNPKQLQEKYDGHARSVSFWEILCPP